MVKHRHRTYRKRRLVKYRKKWDPEIAGKRFGSYEDPRGIQLGDAVETFNEIIERTDVKLAAHGVESELYDQYEAFTQRQGSMSRAIEKKTREDETEILKTEFTTRGLDPAVLEDIKNIGSDVVDEHLVAEKTLVGTAKVGVDKVM